MLQGSQKGVYSDTKYKIKCDIIDLYTLPVKLFVYILINDWDRIGGYCPKSPICCSNHDLAKLKGYRLAPC